MSNLGAVILAAGASVRLGQPKQLLVWRGKPLVARAAEGVLSAGIREVVVVIGADAERVRGALDVLENDVRIVENHAWAEGMGTSVRAGVEALLEKSPLLDGVMIVVCDQPFFSERVAEQLVGAWKIYSSAATANSDRLIVAARYEGRFGVPAIFGKGYRADLLALDGAAGARRILLSNTERVVPVDLPELAADVDTPEDWARLRGSDEAS